MTEPAKTGRRASFITFEGGDGVGKSTQIARLAAHLEDRGLKVVVTREPGGSPGAEAIRAMIVDGATDRWSPLAEALMMYAARADHLEKTINPARARGAIVISDRFADSTLAYQGMAGALGAEKVEALRKLVVGEDRPDLTFILDAPIEVGLARAGKRGGHSRFEAKGAAYQERVRQAFLDIAAAEPDRCMVIDATQTPDAVAEKIAQAVKDRLGIG